MQRAINGKQIVINTLLKKQQKVVQTTEGMLRK